MSEGATQLRNHEMRFSCGAATDEPSFAITNDSRPLAHG